MKRQYMTPTVLVVKLQQRHHILAGSTRGFVQGLSAPDEDFTLKENGFEEYDEDM